MQFHLTSTGFKYVSRGPRDHGQWTLRAYHLRSRIARGPDYEETLITNQVDILMNGCPI